MPLPLMIIFATFVFSVAALWGGRKLALKFGFADKPGGRKKHDHPVPPIGGLVILPAFVIFTRLAGYDNVAPWSLIAGIATLLIMGTIDDARPVKPWIKFTLMVWTACFVVTFGEAQIGQLGNLFGFGMVELGWLSKGFTIMCLVLLMNAINMMDGVDGLSGGFCALATAIMMAACAQVGLWSWFWGLGILLAALAGFLVFNMRHPWRSSASVFMGDSGALCLGLLLGWFAIHLTQMSLTHLYPPPISPIAIIWVIALPVMDAFALFIVRSLRGLHPFNADRQHFHHRLLDAGFTPGQTTLIMLGLIAVLSAIGFTEQVFDVPPVLLFTLWMILFVAHIIGIVHPRGYGRFSQIIKAKLHKDTS